MSTARRRRLHVLLLVASSLVGATGGHVSADRGDNTRSDSSSFALAGSFYVDDNLRPSEPTSTPTSAEIVDVTDDGRTLLYTDGYTGRLGFVDIRRPDRPRAAGTLDLPGDPTSVAVHGRWALVAVVTSDDFTAPTGALLVVDIAARSIVRTIELAGQPDSVMVAPSGRYAAIVIENERDEDVDDGLLPQLPGGLLHVVDLRSHRPDRWTTREVALTGLADVAPEDPEPEYVDINGRDQAVVSLQENNHLAVVDLRRAAVTADFSAGEVDLAAIDTTEESLGPQGQGLISLDGQVTARRREPDTVAWIDDDTFATANEGDYEDAEGVEGGSRSFTLFNVSGTVEYEAGNTFEHEIVRAGHYPESRSENKGSEPEGLEVGRVGGRTYLFVAAERANAVGVYDVSRGTPRFVQLLPTGIGPEGLHLHRGVLVVSSETDGADEGFLARPVITLYQLGRGAARTPVLRSASEGGLPIPWTALSGLAGDPHDARTVWAVSDSYLAQAYLYRIDIGHGPATIEERIAIGGVDVADQHLGDYDLEGVAARAEGGFWFASEGRVDEGSSRPNLIVRTDAAGAVLDAVELPPALVAGATSSGLEGVAVTGSAAAGSETVWVALQRGWVDDPAGIVTIGRYDVAAATWTFAGYRLDVPRSPAGGWVGLSELTALPDGRLAVVERDNQLGQDARIKAVYIVDPRRVTFVPAGQPLPVLAKTLHADLLGVLDQASIAVPDKLEGLAVTRDRRVFVVTDNDGVDENYGETIFLELDRSRRF